MESNLNLAFLLLIVGMATVFIILLLVVFLGNVIIRLTNHFAPGEPKIPKKGGDSSGVSNRQMAAIIAAVTASTNGRGSVVNVERVS